MDSEVWTVRRILSWIEGYLAEKGDANPRLASQWLVSEALGVPKVELFLDPDRPLTPEERGLLRSYTRRRAAGEPLQYITGHAAFRYIVVKVAPGVLIPRPETEVLVSEALALLPAARKPQDDFDDEVLRLYAAAQGDEGAAKPEAAEAAEARRLLVADICTGTGCIACSLASERKDVTVFATDISQRAVELAKENVEALGLGDSVEVLQCDLADGLDDSLVGSLDLVVSNPPYVPSAVLADLPQEVSEYEPGLALDGGSDGLDVFRRLLAWCASALRPGGACAFELHETTLEEAAALARAEGFVDVRVVNDLAQRPRVLVARRKTV